MASEPIKAGDVKLPPGVSVVVARETSASGPSGAIEQGMSFTIQLPSGATTSVFFPYRQLNNTAEVAKVIDERVRQIQAVERL